MKGAKRRTTQSPPETTIKKVRHNNNSEYTRMAKIKKIENHKCWQEYGETGTWNPSPLLVGM